MRANCCRGFMLGQQWIMKVTGFELHKSKVRSEWRKNWRKARSEAEIWSDDGGYNWKRADGNLITIQAPPVLRALCQALGLEGVSQPVLPIRAMAAQRQEKDNGASPTGVSAMKVKHARELQTGAPDLTSEGQKMFLRANTVTTWRRVKRLKCYFLVLWTNHTTRNKNGG